jgi:cysteine-rich repeat protein
VLLSSAQKTTCAQPGCDAQLPPIDDRQRDYSFMTTWNLGIVKGVVGAVVACFACVPVDPPVEETGDSSSSSEGGETASPTDTGNGPSVQTSTTDNTETTDSSGATSTGDTTATTSGASCGDGSVTGDEVCDDGANDGSYGGCMPGCGAFGPSCGDGNLDDGDGEVCDDGTNDGSYDGCMADCKAFGPSCGDGNVDDADGEACDDGNDVDDDDCSNACAAPVCGDGIVQMGIGEVCDDGVNDGAYGGCNADCLSKGPYCGDGMLQDADGEACDDANGDSQDGCLGNCAVPQSCAEVLAFDPAVMDGVYGFTVGDKSWQAWCDMTTDGGGWTLAAKVAPTNSWQYGDPRWTNNVLLSPNQPGFDHVSAKLETWNSVPFTEIHVGMESPNMPMNNPPTVTYVTVDVGPQNSLYELFMPDDYVATTLSKATWSTLVPEASLQDNCDQEGINNAPNGMAGARVRIGILANKEMDCSSPESVLGLGIAGMPNLCMNNPFSSVGNQNCDNLAMPVKKQGFGFIFVR